MGFIVNLAYQYADNVAFLLLAALGLIIILGVLNIINLAHGEMIMMGAYVTSMANQQGLPLWLCFLISTLAVGFFGFLIERLVIRRFTQDKLGAMVATRGAGNLRTFDAAGSLATMAAGFRGILVLGLPVVSFRDGHCRNGYPMAVFLQAAHRSVHAGDHAKRCNGPGAWNKYGHD